ncbi:cell adhesion molecule 3-like [Diadema antillarum]|uniref:cell adhesion molecule 3-like n=1 Tax=Diadema antillarum TaxID=105358 RepID=UPI003A8BDADA
MKVDILVFHSFVSLILCRFPEGMDALTVSTSIQGQGVVGFAVVITCKYDPPSSHVAMQDHLKWFVNQTELVSCKFDAASNKPRCDSKTEDSSKYSFTADGLCCGSITIRRLAEDDENTYTCLVTTSAGIGTSTAILNITHPKIARLPHTVKLTGTDNLQVNLSQEISCTSARSYPAPTFRWYIDTREVTADAVTLPPETDGQGGPGEVVNATSTLTYRPSREDHGRTLVCSLSFRVSPFNTTVLNSSVDLDIHDPPLISNPQASTNWNGESCTASLSCSPVSNPPANYFRWVKVGAERVFNSSRTRHFIHAPRGLDDNERIGTLLIEDVQASDYGSYQCIAYDDDRERSLTSATLSLIRPSKRINRVGWGG